MSTSTGMPWLDLVLAVLASGTGSFGLGLYLGYRWGRRRRDPGGDDNLAGRHRLP